MTMSRSPSLRLLTTTWQVRYGRLPLPQIQKQRLILYCQGPHRLYPHPHLRRPRHLRWPNRRQEENFEMATLSFPLALPGRCMTVAAPKTRQKRRLSTLTLPGLDFYGGEMKRRLTRVMSSCPLTTES